MTENMETSDIKETLNKLDDFYDDIVRLSETGHLPPSVRSTNLVAVRRASGILMSSHDAPIHDNGPYAFNRTDAFMSQGTDGMKISVTFYGRKSLGLNGFCIRVYVVPESAPYICHIVIMHDDREEALRNIEDEMVPLFIKSILEAYP